MELDFICEAQDTPICAQCRLNQGSRGQTIVLKRAPNRKDGRIGPTVTGRCLQGAGGGLVSVGGIKGDVERFDLPILLRNHDRTN